MKSRIYALIIIALTLTVFALVNGRYAIDAGERVATYAIDTTAAQLNQPYSIPDALERQAPPESARAWVFIAVLLLALIVSVIGLFALYLGAPFLKNARALVREWTRGHRPAPSRPLPALPRLERPAPPAALPATATPPDTGEVQWL